MKKTPFVGLMLSASLGMAALAGCNLPMPSGAQNPSANNQQASGTQPNSADSQQAITSLQADQKDVENYDSFASSSLNGPSSYAVQDFQGGASAAVEPGGFGGGGTVSGDRGDFKPSTMPPRPLPPCFGGAGHPPLSQGDPASQPNTPPFPPGSPPQRKTPPPTSPPNGQLGVASFDGAASGVVSASGVVGVGLPGSLPLPHQPIPPSGMLPPCAAGGLHAKPFLGGDIGKLQQIIQQLQQQLKTIQARLDQLDQKRVAKMDQGEKQHLQSAFGNVKFVSNGDGTESAEIKTSFSKSVDNGQTVSRSLDMKRTRDSQSHHLLSGSTDITETLPDGGGHTVHWEKTLQTDGSYDVVFNQSRTFKDGTKRVADWNKVIDANGNVSGTGTVTWFKADGSTRSTENVTLKGQQDNEALMPTGAIASPAVSTSADASVGNAVSASAVLNASNK